MIIHMITAVYADEPADNTTVFRIDVKGRGSNLHEGFLQANHAAKNPQSMKNVSVDLNY